MLVQRNINIAIATSLTLLSSSFHWLALLCCVVTVRIGVIHGYDAVEQIHEIEVRAKIHSKFRFPYFKEMMFFAASRFLTALRSQQVCAWPF